MHTKILATLIVAALLPAMPSVALEPTAEQTEKQGLFGADSPSEIILGSFQQEGLWDQLPKEERADLLTLVAALDQAEAELSKDLMGDDGSGGWPRFVSASIETCTAQGSCGGTYKNNNTYGHYAYNTGDYWGCSKNDLSPVIGLSVFGDVEICSQHNENEIKGDIDPATPCVGGTYYTHTCGGATAYVVIFSCNAERNDVCGKRH